MRRLLRILVPAALVLLASTAYAQSKLDARARIAVSQMRAGVNLQELQSAGAAVTEEGQLDVFIRGTVSRGVLEALGVRVRSQIGDIFTADVPVSAIDAVAALSGVQSVRGAARAELNLNVSVPTTGASALRGAGPTFTGVNGAGILVGDVDSGLDFDHGDFKTAGNLTRCVTIWDQTVAAVNPPAPYTYGREWTAAEINGALCTETDVNGHGQHCMGIIAGDGSQTGGPVPAFTYVGMAPMADLIEVKTDLTTTHILDGVAYFMAKATALGKLAVCNLSLGSQFGPHDGTSDFEAGLDALTGPGKIITVSAGNDRGTNWHAGFSVPAGGDSAKFNVTSTTNLPLGNPTAAIDGYYSVSDNFDIYLRSPSAANPIVGPIHLGTSNAAYPGTLLPTSANVYIENGLFLTATGDREVYFEVTRTSSTHPVAGTWTIYFVPVAAPVSGRVDMWKYYSGSGTTTFTLKNTNDHLVSEPGNAPNVITTAAWETKNNWVDCGSRNVSYSAPAPIGAIATFSSPGPSRNGAQKPDIAAPGMGIGSARSFDLTINCGTTASTLLNDLNHIINQGTSMAAPHVAGASALLMQKFGAMTPAQVKTYLNAHAIVDGNTGGVWNADFGNGKLFLGDLLDPTVQVTRANGGETFVIGTNENVTWAASDNGAVANVDLQLSRTGAGGPYVTIAASVANTGTYSWNVTAPASNDCWIKVVATDGASNTGSDISDAAFQIIDGATATTLSLFDATVIDGGVELRWRFSDPSGVSSVRVERSEGSDAVWQTLALDVRDESGMSVATDRAVETGHLYRYRLAANNDGTRQTFGSIQVTAGDPILEFALGRPLPNPTASAMRIDYALPRSAKIDIGVYDMQGRKVAQLVEGTMAAGRNQASWNGRIGGQSAPAGIYFVRMIAPGTRLSQRLVVTH